jgi:hypothetical protein
MGGQMDGSLLDVVFALSTDFHLVLMAWMMAGKLAFAPFPGAGEVGCAAKPEAGKVGLGWLLQPILDASSQLEQFPLSFLILFLADFELSFPSRSSFGIKNDLLQSSSGFC